MTTTTYKTGDVILYNDGREGHRDVKGTVLNAGESKVVQSEDRADTNTIYFSNPEWMAHIRLAPTLDGLIQAQIERETKAFEQATRRSAEEREEYRKKTLQQFSATIEKKISAELLQILDGVIMNVNDSKESWPRDFEYRFFVDTEEWAIISVYDYICAPDCPKREYDSINAFRLEGQPWDESILRSIRAYRDRKEKAAAETARKAAEPPAELKPEPVPPKPIAGPFRVRDSVYANKLQDVLNQFDNDGYFILEIHYEPSEPGYDGTYTVIAESMNHPGRFAHERVYTGEVTREELVRYAAPDCCLRAQRP